MWTVNLVPLMCFFTVTGVQSVTKTWVPNTNYENPSNWDVQRVPCQADRVIFPSYLQSAVRLRDGRTIVQELVLPSDGEIILPFTGSLEVTGKSSSKDCVGQDVVYTRSWEEAWLDPANWRTEGRDARDPVPHLERIPCTHDRVLFPAASSFRVRLPEVPVTVGSISLLGQDTSPSDWEQALLTDSGELQFVSNDGDYTRTRSVVLTGEECGDKLGCPCPGPSLLEDAVCKYARQRQRDCFQSFTPCADPVKPLGHCCAICGAYLLLEYSKPLLGLSRLQNLLDSFLGQEKYARVGGHMSKPAAVLGAATNTIQVVLVDIEEYSGDCNDLADAFAEKIKNNDFFGVSNVAVHKAGNVIALSTWGGILGILFGTFLAAILAMGFIYFFFIGYREVGWALPNQSFVFARFENAPSETEEATEGRVHVLSGDLQEPESPVPETPLAAAFDNPMFGNTKMEERKTLPPAQPGEQVTHENPVYSELKRREERQKEEEPPLTPIELEETDTANLIEVSEEPPKEDTSELVP